MVKKPQFVVLLIAFVVTSGCAPSGGADSTEAFRLEQSTEFVQPSELERQPLVPTAQPTDRIPTPTSMVEQSIPSTATPETENDEEDDWNRERVGNSKANGILNFLLRGKYQYLDSYLHFASLPCTNVYGQSWLPACLEDEVEGTVVEAFPLSSTELIFLRRSDIGNWLDFEIIQLVAVYGDYQESDQPEYWSQFYYVMMFVLNDSRLLLVRTTEDYIIRMDFIPLPWIPLEEIIPYISTFTFPQPTGLYAPEYSDLIEKNYGIVEGKLCFPGERIPRMMVYFQEVGADSATSLEIGSNQLYYATRLAPGIYHAYEWSDGSGALYSEYVLCDYENGEKCDNHDLVEFEVFPGKVTYGIDICDWYALQENIPRPPAGSNPGGN